MVEMVVATEEAVEVAAVATAVAAAMEAVATEADVVSCNLLPECYYCW